MKLPRKRLFARTGIVAQSKKYIKHGLSPIVKNYSTTRKDLSPDLWRLSPSTSGVLHLEGCSLRSLVDHFGSPLHVVDAAKLHENISDFLATPGGGERGCEVYYSYKTNPVPTVLQRMHDQGVGAEVTSAYELWLALKLGVPPQKVVYNGPWKSSDSLRVAVEQDIGLVNINHREEIAQCAAIARQLSKRLRVGVRVAVPGAWAGQFGETVDNGAALQAYEEALAVPDLQVVALHAHLGKEISTAEQVTNYVSRVLAFCEELHTRFGLDLEVLDLGGSLACPTTVHLSRRDVRMNTTFQADLVPRAPESVLSIRAFVAQVVGLVESHYRAMRRKPPRIFLEPGRAMTGNTQMLLCQVVTTKADERFTYAVLDAGVSVAGSVSNEYHQLFHVGPIHSTHRKMYRLIGPTCMPGDVLYAAWELPELMPGDALAVMDSGAYFVPFATSFSFPRPGIILVENGHAEMIRRAETFADLVSPDCYAAR